MSTVFGIMKDKVMTPILLRKNGGRLQWLPGGNVLFQSDAKKLHALDNSNQGLDTVGDLRKSTSKIDPPENTPAMHALVAEFTSEINIGDNKMDLLTSLENSFGSWTLKKAFLAVETKANVEEGLCGSELSDAVALTITKIFTGFETDDPTEVPREFFDMDTFSKGLLKEEVEKSVIMQGLQDIFAGKFEVIAPTEFEFLVSVIIHGVETEVELLGMTEYVETGTIHTEITVMATKGDDIEHVVESTIANDVSFVFDWVEVVSVDQSL